MPEKILIIGAGPAGLSAGIHALQNGFEAVIYEKQQLPGGLCTARRVHDYIFEGCIGALQGTKPGSQFNKLWQEICPFNEMTIINHEKIMSVESSEGEPLHLYSDLNRLEEHLSKLFPENGPEVKEICGAAKKMSRIEIPFDKASGPTGLKDITTMMFKMLPLFNVLGRYSRISVEEYAERIKAPLLKKPFR